MWNGLLKTLFLLLLCQGVNAAETRYVHDQLRLGVRAAPDSSGSSIAVVSTGDALTVLGEKDGFTHIRTEQGVDGWVSKGYLSTELPARNQLVTLQQAHQALQQARDELQQQLEDSRLQQEQKSVQQEQKLEQQVQRLGQLNQTNALLQGQLNQLKVAPAAPYDQYLWLILPALLLSLMVGFFVGVRWKARQVADRIGGLRL